MTNADFIFVNKNARSSLLSRSDGDERRRILSHVQKPPPRPKMDEFVVVTKYNYGLDENSIGRPSETIKRICHAEKDSTTTRSGSRLHRKKSASAPIMQRPKPSPSPYEVVSQVDINCFRSFSMKMTLEMQSMLAHYASTIIQAIIPTSHTALEAKRYIIACAGLHPAVLCAVLGTANLSVFSRNHDKRYAREADRFRHLTVVHVQKRLSQGGPVTAPTAFAVALLLLCECGQGDFQTVKIHYHGLVKMMAVMDSPCDIPFALRLGIQACLHYCSAMLPGKPPQLFVSSREIQPVEASVPPHKPVNIAWLHGDKLPKIASEPYREFLGEEIFNIISELLNLRIIRENVIRGSIELSGEEIQNLHIERLVQERRLLSMPFDESSRPQSPARNALRLVLYLVSGPPLDISEPRNPFRTSLAQQLKRSLSESNISGLWKPCSDLLLVALLVTAYVAYQQEEWPWLVSRTAFVCRELGIDTFSRLEKVLHDSDLAHARLTESAARIWSSINDLWIDGDWNASIFLE